MASIDNRDYIKVAKSEVDASSPGSTTLFLKIAQNIRYLKDWLGRSYLSNAIADHNHDGVNSALVHGTTGGAVFVVTSWINNNLDLRGPFIYCCDFDPECVWALSRDMDATSQEGSNLHVVGPGDTDEFSTRFCKSDYQPHNNHGGPVLRFGGFGFTLNSTFGPSLGKKDAIVWKSRAGFVKVGTYTGDGTTEKAVTGVGFKPTFVMAWIGGSATDTNAWPCLRTVSMAGKFSRIYDRVGSVIENGITSLDSDGFKVGSFVGVNKNATTYNYIAFKDGSFAGERILHVAHPVGASGDYPLRITGVPFVPHAVIAVMSATDVVSQKTFWICTRGGTLIKGTTGGGFYSNNGTGWRTEDNYIFELLSDGCRIGTGFSDTSPGDGWKKGDTWDLFFLRGGSTPSGQSF